MKILLAAVLATMIVAPCMAASENESEDKRSADVLTPGVNEPRTPDTLKSAPDQRIQNEGRASERTIEEDRTVGERRPDDRSDERK